MWVAEGIMPEYIIQRRRRWYAILEIPKELRKHFGKARFKQSLQTDSRSLATRKALPLIAEWKLAIERGRTGEAFSPSEYRTMLEWQRDYRNASPEEKEVLDDILEDRIENLQHRGDRLASVFGSVVTSKAFPIEQYLDEWITTLEDTAKTKDMKRSTVLEFVRTFEFSTSVDRQAVKEWAHDLIHERGQAKKTIQRKLSFLGRYWKYLQSRGYLKGEEEPFRGVIEFPRRERTKAAASRGRLALEDREVVAILDRAIEDGDHSLGALIYLAMFTGARIEELCSLKSEDVSERGLRVSGAKTSAGNREIPIHSRLKEVLKDLKASSYDGYLLSGLTFNKYGDRSNAIGKRFGHIKESMGMDGRKVFHSIRMTVVTQLQNAGVGADTVADIVGHEKESFTFGTYSGGASMGTKRRAIEKLRYPLRREYHFTNKQEE